MKTKKNKLSSDLKGGNSFYTDLNDPDIQEKILYYIRNGIATTDKNGHQAKLQVRCTPIQADILESVRSKAPKGFWRTQSDALRSIIAVGCFITLKVLNDSESVQELSKEFQLLELLGMIGKKTRENDLAAQARKAALDLNLSDYNPDQIIDGLQKILREKKKTGSVSEI